MTRRAALALIAFAACDEHGSGAGGVDALPDQLDVPVDAAATSSLTATPLTIDFGTVALGASSAPAIVTVTFTGPSGSNVSQVVTGTNPSAFGIESTTCTALSSGDTCTIRVRFAPAMVGASTATLLVMVPGATSMIALGGTGAPQASLLLAPSVHDFGAVGTGTTAARSFTLTNATGAAAGPLAVTVAGTDASQFAKGADTCTGATVAPNQTCTVVMSFTPATVGAKAASLQIAGTPGGSTTASLLGTGAAPSSALVIAPASFDFGTVGQGNSSLGKMFTITNSGTVTTGNLATMMAGSHPGDFLKQADQCNGHTLGPGAACTLFITFEPGPVGARNARIQVSASPGGSAAADLGGTCTP